LFQKVFKGFATLIETVGDKIFLAISNLYFSKQSRRMYVDFSTTFHPVLVPNFVDVLLVKVVVALHRVYLAKKPRLDIYDLFS